MSLELNGDVAQIFDLCSSFDATIDKKSQSQRKSEALALSLQSPIETLKALPMSFGGENVRQLSKFVNELIAVHVQLCFGSYISWTSSLLPDDTLNQMQAKTFELCPFEMATIREILGYNSKLGESRRKHLMKTYQRMSMFLFFSLARVRNSRLFSMWAVVSASVSYGAVQRASARYASVFFGHSCSRSTMHLLTQPFREQTQFRERVKASLDRQVVNINKDQGLFSVVVLILIFDNAQKNYSYKFQRGGKTSKFIKVTARCFIEVWQGPWKHFVFKGDPHVPVTYVNQSIPSPIGMATKYEMIDFNSAFDVSSHIVGDDDLDNPALTLDTQQPWTAFLEPDFTGCRTASYFHLLKVAVNLRCLWRHLSLDKPYAFQPAHYATNTFFNSLRQSLSSQRQRKGILHRAGSFQRRSVLAYRGLRPKAMSLSLPVLCDDETTKEGIAAVVTKLLLRSGLLVENPNKEGEHEPALLACNGIEDRYVIVVCDGLSHERWRAYLKDILNIQANMEYQRHYRLCREIIKAASRTVLCPGDLHLTMFHTLSPIYRVFYGGFLQPFKVALGIKRIEWQKVEKCYEQSSLMVLLILMRVEAQLMEVFVCSLGTLPTEKELTLSAHYVSIRFDKWLDDKIAYSLDPWFRTVCHFTKMARHYRLFKESLRNGDVLAVELLLVEFMDVFAGISKPKCLESTLCTVEEWYGRIPYWMLQLIRDNRTSKLYDGRRRDGMETAERPLDEFIELQNAAYSSMDFPPSVEAWVTHSQNVSLIKQSSVFVETEYRRKFDVDALDDYNEGKDDGDRHDIGNRKKGSTAGSRTDQKQLIDEVLLLSGVMVETPGRDMNRNQIWSVLHAITTKVSINKEKTNVNDVGLNGGDEELVSAALTEMQEIRNKSNEHCEDMLNDDSDDDSINVAPDADAVDEEGEQMETDEDVQEDERLEEHDEILIGGRGSKKVKVSKVPLSQFADKDTYSLGHAKLIKMNLPLVRLRRKQREAREQQALHDNLYDFQSTIGGDFEVVLGRLVKAQTENSFLGQRHGIALALEISLK
jgi:hypothetical protein